MNQFGVAGSFNGPEINPATGFPMIDGIGGVDVGGNPFGTDLSEDIGLESGSPFDPFGSDFANFCDIGSSGFSWD